MTAAVETMAWAGEVPWHGLGNRVDANTSPEDMEKAAGLDWKVHLSPLYAEAPNGDVIEVPDRFALIRDKDNKVLTVAGSRWKPLQNADMLGFMRDYVAAGGATLETAGSLHGGKIVWGLANLNHSFEVTKGDKVNGYLLFTSPHEVGKSILLSTTSVRVVCQNTMTIAMRQGTVEYRQSHIHDFDVDAAKAAIENAHECLDRAAKQAKTLSKLKLGIEDAVKKVLVPVMFPEIAEDDEMLTHIMNQETQPKNLQQIIHTINTGPGATPENGWGVLNGITHWCDHVAGRSSSTRLFRSWVGDLRQLKLDVNDKLLELAA